MKFLVCFFLVSSFSLVSTVVGYPNQLIPARSAPTEEDIQPSVKNTTVYIALHDAFSQVNDEALSSPANTTRNDLEEGKCAPNILIFARGTTETGNIGKRVGVPLIKEVDAALAGSVSFQGVNNYPADIIGYFANGSFSGARDMANQVARAAVNCPGSSVFLSGYSQGAQVARKATTLIPAAQKDIISGIVLFGDPNKNHPFPDTLKNKVMIICNKGDLICEGLPLPFGPHLEYAKTIPSAAQWIKSRARLLLG